ncbi:MAG: 8-oxo-dGTP pyrophosphatase MutT (NUDIX family) [Paracoccaceae bacterium]|jgi:8-oxo-dGTP pyrophosphatase MutT (NUDIX family)
MVVTKGGKREIRTQFAALCYRILKGETQILLVTSRSSKRWIVPKGWPANGLTPAQSAAKEAWEEAGVKGRTFENCVGLYSYEKVLTEESSLPCVVALFPILVSDLKNNFPEKTERTRRWFTPQKAAKKVAEPELRAILANFTAPPTPKAGR